MEGLPEGWEWKRLGDVLQFSRNGANLKQDKSGNGIPISRIETISYGVINPNKVGYTQESDDNTIQTCKLLDGDLLFSHINSLEHIGKTAIYENNPPVLLHGINLLLLRPNMKIVDPKFLHIVFQKYRREKIFWSMANKSVNQASINQTRLNDIRMPLPPLPAQRRIVAVLEQAVAVKRQRHEADALTGALLQSVFLEMFGDPVRNEKRWEKKELKEFGEIKTGNTPPRINPSNYGDYIEWIKSDNINLQSIYLERSQEFLSEEGLKIGRLAPKESILITCIAGSISCIGNAAIADRDVAFNQQINAIIPRSDVNELFLYYVILLSREYIQNHATKSMTKMINKGILSELLFIAPPLPLQQQFAQIVANVEALREKQRVSGEEIGGLFDGLMQRAFRGEIVEAEA